MNSFITYEEPLKQILEVIVASDGLHAKWLNTLSYLENCGARKIAACQHPILVKEEMLKHAAEEFRHAHHLKRQIAKISDSNLEYYCLGDILGGVASLQYLNMLNLKCSRGLTRSHKLHGGDLRAAAYLLVTYAIERRAEELYACYDAVLRKSSSKVSVKAIMLEEKEHLNEMTAHLALMPSGRDLAAEVCLLESKLCQKWVEQLQRAVAFTHE